MIFSESEPAVAFGYGEAPLAGSALRSDKRTIRKRFQPSGQAAHIVGPPVLKYRRCPLQRLVGSSCGVEARRAEPQARRAKPEAGGSSFSLGHLARGLKDLSAMRITLGCQQRYINVRLFN